MSVKKERVRLGLLAGGSTNNVSITALAYALPFISNDPGSGFAFEFDVEDGVRPQEFARNNLIARFLKSKSDVLLMIDDDMIALGWTTLDVLKTKEYDIAAPLQYMFMPYDPEVPRMPECYPCAFMFDNTQANKIKPFWPAPGVEESEVDAVGSGCMAIRRRVFESPRMEIEPGLDPPAYFKNRYKANGDRISGLDIDFCRRAKAAGFRIKVNWRAQVGHYKRLDLNQVDMYAKLSVQQGWKAGVNHAVRMAQESGRPSNGDSRVAGPAFGSDGEVAPHRLDRPGQGGALSARFADLVERYASGDGSWPDGADVRPQDHAPR